MVVQCLGSSSKGNCYVFKAAGEVLIVEAGLPLAEVKKSLTWQINGIVGCVVSHQHNDHAKYIGEMLACGIKVLALPEVFEAQGVRNRVFCREAQPHHGYMMGGFKVFTFDVTHDVPCLGFVIDHKEMGRTLFVTDAMVLQYSFPRLNHIMIECNYCDSVLEQCINEGVTHPGMRERLMRTHMELQTTKMAVKAQGLAEVNEIVLLHLSAHHSDKERFKGEIEAAFGKPTYIAEPGLQLELSQVPY